MPKIVFIGAGSFGFTRGLVRDLLTFPLLEGSEIALVDINKERLDFARRRWRCETAILMTMTTSDACEALRRSWWRRRSR